jgi:holo-[acyl-carrier protein] synthase
VVVGLGLDVVEIARVQELLARFGGRARARVFTDGEQAYCEGKARAAQHYAARFAAKEACFKALSGAADAQAIGWREMEVVSTADGRPSLALHGRAAARAAELGVSRALVTLTHSDGVAAAVVVLEAER